jgi:hypothetical protein
MRRLVVLFVAVGMLLVGAGSAFAGGSNVYPNGAEGFWMGAAPPPGFYYINYDLVYSSHRFNNNSGNEIKAGPVGPFKTDVFAQVSRFLYMSNYKILGADWGAHIFIVGQHNSTDTAFGNQHITGFGDTIVDPFILAWHTPNFHVTTGVDIYVPTGNYEAGRVDNLGANAFVYEPIIAFTYMTPLKGLTTSMKMMYDIAQTNNDFVNPFNGARGNLEYGNEFHFDYSIDYQLTDNWKAGIEGYYYVQTTDDEFNDVKVKNNKGMVWAIGPGVEYAQGRWIASFKTEIEVQSKNRPQGIANWLRVVYVL